MKSLSLLPAAILLAGLAYADGKNFENWVVGCDNTLTCAAIGFPGEDGAPIGYVRVERAAGPDAAPSVTVVTYSRGEEGPATIAVTIDGKPFGAEAFIGTYNYGYARATLNAAQSAALIDALANARSMTLKHTEAIDPPIPASVDGSSAALRYMDAEQKRADTLTALVAKGKKAKNAVPAAPKIPTVTATKLSIVERTPSFPGAELPQANIDDCGVSSSEPIVFTLSGGNVLWGVCSSTGAYNYTYDFYVVDRAGKASPLKPGTEGGDTLSLTNPYRSKDGKMLMSFAKSRGVGDCGGTEAFAWDGKNMVRVLDRAMNVCRGISSEDWITTYRATVK